MIITTGNALLKLRFERTKNNKSVIKPLIIILYINILLFYSLYAVVGGVT